MIVPRASPSRRLPGLLLGAVVLGASGFACAQDSDFFRIGTGATGGTYFPVGALLANAISNPPGSRPCSEGGSCGVPGLIAVAQSTNGSVANVKAIRSGDLESGLCQADVAYWAYTGQHGFKGDGPAKGLRAIANLYPEAVHIVVRADSGVDKVADLKGKRISLGEEGSGTLVDAEIILAAYGLKTRQLKAQYLKLGQAADQMADGKLDGLFFVAGAPAGGIVDLARRVPVKLVPIAGKQAEKILKTHRFFGAGTIGGGLYEGVPETTSLTVGAQWIVSDRVDAKLVYAITRALWNEGTLRLLAQGHPKAAQIRLKTALTGIAIPLHPGAERFYREAGLLEDEATESPADRPAN